MSEFWGETELDRRAARIEELEKEKLEAAAEWLAAEDRWFKSVARSAKRVKELEDALRTVFLVHHGGLRVDGHFQYDEDEDECIEIAIDAGLTEDKRDWE